jgi:hypothetical protein
MGAKSITAQIRESGRITLSPLVLKILLQYWERLHFEGPVLGTVVTKESVCECYDVVSQRCGRTTVLEHTARDRGQLPGLLVTRLLRVVPHAVSRAMLPSATTVAGRRRLGDKPRCSGFHGQLIRRQFYRLVLCGRLIIQY